MIEQSFAAEEPAEQNETWT